MEGTAVPLGAIVVPGITAIVIPKTLWSGFGDFAGRCGAKQQPRVLIVGMAPVGPVKTRMLVCRRVGDIRREATMPVIGVLAEGKLPNSSSMKP